MPGLEASYDGKEFPVIDVAVPFGWPKQLGLVGAWVPFPIGVCL